MRFIWITWMAAAVCLGLVAPERADAAERRVALAIGNGGYKDAPLANPVNDARAMGEKLASLGFEVEVRENLGLRDMTRAITGFGQRVKQSGGSALFFYAGHGMQVAGRNYLIPVDAEIVSESATRSEAVDVDMVMAQLAEAGDAVNLVILDACRNNPFERAVRGGAGRGLAMMDAPKGTLVAYATAPGKTAADGTGANGVYTGELLKVLSEPGLKAEDVFKKVRAQVTRATGDTQVPWETSSITGDFYFVPKGASVTITPPGGGAPAAGFDERQIEIAFWDSIKASNDAADFRDYLARYPNGSFTGLATRRLAALGPSPAGTSPAGTAPPPDRDAAARADRPSTPGATPATPSPPAATAWPATNPWRAGAAPRHPGAGARAAEDDDDDDD